MKEKLCRVLRMLGLFELIRRTIARRRITIINLHKPAPEVFRNHLAQLSNRYNFINLDASLSALRNNDWSSIPDYPLVITIDDGHASTRDLVPILREFGISATAYVCTAIVGTKRRFWFSESRTNNEQLKRMKDSDRINWLREAEGFDPLAEYPDDQPEAMGVEQMRDSMPTLSFQCHTRTHPILTMCSDDRCRDEVINCRAELEELLGVTCKHFNFPNGAYGPREMKLVRDAGYESARTTHRGWINKHTSPYELPCMLVSDNASTDVLLGEVSGVMGWLSYVKRGSIWGKCPIIRPKHPMQ